jgi:predicted pyridoxine 5'-phosphate oxidase superfamily flavin-nucleotide-binding protein
MTVLTTVEDLEAIYGVPNLMSTVKEVATLTPQYRALIEASPFVVLATVGPEGLDASPRGDRGEVVRIADEWTLMLPDRRGHADRRPTGSIRCATSYATRAWRFCS